jgi:hypothetical protein
MLLEFYRLVIIFGSGNASGENVVSRPSSLGYLMWSHTNHTVQLSAEAIERLACRIWMCLKMGPKNWHVKREHYDKPGGLGGVLVSNKPTRSWFLVLAPTMLPNKFHYIPILSISNVQPQWPHLAAHLLAAAAVLGRPRERGVIAKWKEYDSNNSGCMKRSL